jgi:hypothetical protein
MFKLPGLTFKIFYIIFRFPDLAALWIGLYLGYIPKASPE